jgi:transposase InsO family protein
VPESTGTATRLVRGDPTATPIAETIPIDARTSDARIAPTGRQSEAARIATAPPVLASTGTATRLVRGDPNSLTFSFDGAINGRSVDILVDSGAYLSFLSEDFYREHLAATRQQATTDVPVTLADGTPYTVNTVVRTKLRINQPYGHPYETVVQLHVLPMRNGYDLLLGEPFLREMHVVLSYESNSMAIRRGERWITLYSAAARPIVSPKTFNRLVGTIADGRLCHPAHVSEHPSDDFPLISDTDGPCGAIHFIPGPVPDSDTPENESPLPDARPVLAVTDAAPASPGTSATSEADSALADLSPADASFVRGLQHQYPGVFDGTSQAHTTGATKRAHAVTHSIKLQAGTEPVAASFRRMSPQMLGELQKQLATFLANGEIEPARGPWASPILFVRKKNGTYRFCVDYRALNAKTIKDRYPLPRMEDCLDQLRGACYFTALDLQSGYHQVPMAEKSKPLTAFTCRYGTYQFRVMPFGLTNAPATFQAWMNDILRPFLDRFVVVYLDDILIYSRTEEEHRRHLTDVMRALEDAGARLNLAKCKFFQDQTTFLGHVVTRQGVHTDPRLVAKIREHPRPTSKKDVRSFLGVVNYYRRFIQGCAQISAPLYDLTDNSHAPMQWTDECEQAFVALKDKLATAPVLTIADENKPFVVHTDASAHAIGAVLSQRDDEGHMHPVAYHSRKLTDAQTRKSTFERELLAIKDALEHWKDYLLGRDDTVLKTDHRPLTHLDTTDLYNDTLVRWWEKISRFHVQIEYLRGEENVVADYFSRPGPSAEHSINAINADDERRGASVLQPDEELRQMILKASKSDKFIKAIVTHLEQGLPSASIFRTLNTHWVTRSDDGFLRYEKPDSNCSRIVVPSTPTVTWEIMRRHHDDLAGGHFGRDKMLQDLQRYYIWPKMNHDVETYCKQCQVCQLVKGTAKQGLLQPLPIPAGPWQHVSMDFVGPLPTTKRKNTHVMVIVDRFTKWAYFIPTKDNLTAEKVAKLFLDTVYSNHGMPRAIISDRDSRFTSDFWQEFLKLLDVKPLMSTAYHPQTDGQTERINRILGDFLRSYCDQYVKNWDDLLVPLQMAYNDSYSSSTKHTPFELDHGYHPLTPKSMLFPAPRHPRHPTTASQLLNGMSQARQIAAYCLRTAQTRQERYANRTRRQADFKTGQMVMLSKVHLSVQGAGLRKLHSKWLGPFRIKHASPERPNVVELDLDDTDHSFHPVVNVERIRHYVPAISPLSLGKQRDGHADVSSDETDEDLERLFGHLIIADPESEDASADSPSADPASSDAGSDAAAGADSTSADPASPPTSVPSPTRHHNGSSSVASQLPCAHRPNPSPPSEDKQPVSDSDDDIYIELSDDDETPTVLCDAPYPPPHT